MKPHTLHLRNMCCQRCIEAVTQELQSLGLVTRDVRLGEATFLPSSKISEEKIEKALNKRGFIVVRDEHDLIVEKVKTILLDFIHHISDDERKGLKLSSLLAEKINTPYRTLLKVFRKQKGMTIEKYFILQKIEKAKELIEQSSLSFSEIANMLGYKSLQHLSGQFKEITGKTMLNYKKSNSRKRIHIDRI